jgi:hypothetical protein
MNSDSVLFGLVRALSWIVAFFGTFWAARMAVKSVGQHTDATLLSRTRWFFVILFVVCMATNLVPQLLKSQTWGIWSHAGVSIGTAVLMVACAVGAFRLCFRKE